MALIRKIVKHKDQELYAYVEFSEEDPKHVVILGKKEFLTVDEVRKFAEEFENPKKVEAPKEVQGEPATPAEAPKDKKRK